MSETPSICFVASIPMALWSFYRLLIARLLRDGHPVFIISSDMHPLEEFARMGCTVLPVPITRVISPWRDILSAIKIFRHLRRIKPSIVHAHTPKGGLLAMIGAAMAPVRCRLYTCHGLASETETGFKRNLLTLTERLTCALAHRVLVVSPSLSRKMTEHRIGSDAKKLILGAGSACGIDTMRFDRTEELMAQARQIRQSLKIPDDAIVIGFIGRLVPDKGIHLLVQAFCELYRENDRVRLLVIGDLEPYRGTLSDETNRLLTEHAGIRRIGFTHGIERYYACMDLLALPTRREGFPYVLLEAGAMRIPVVATAVTGCVDAIEDQVTGLLIDGNRPEQLVDALSGLIRDPARRTEMGRQGRLRVEQGFASERLIAEHLKLYERLVMKA
jgi:glycosyltransferase involved in cell wall biosynthesis